MEAGKMGIEERVKKERRRREVGNIRCNRGKGKEKREGRDKEDRRQREKWKEAGRKDRRRGGREQGERTRTRQ